MTNIVAEKETPAPTRAGVLLSFCALLVGAVQEVYGDVAIVIVLG